MTGVLRAWTVTDNTYSFDDWTAEVVFAETRGRALFHNNFIDLADMEFRDLRVKRSPEFDQYADDGKVPHRALIEAGWFVVCPMCGHHIQKDDEHIFNQHGDAVCADCATEQESRSVTVAPPADAE